jgi:hypothetical protein
MSKMNKTGQIIGAYHVDSINEEATQYFNDGTRYNVTCINCGIKNPGKNKRNPFGAIRSDNLNKRACPKCHYGGKPEIQLKEGLIIKNCVLIKQLNYTIPKRGKAWLLKNNNKIFIRGESDLKHGEGWHINEESEEYESPLAKKGRALLNENGIYHCQDYSIDNLKLEENSIKQLKFDDFLPAFHAFIEWDGTQHEATTLQWGRDPEKIKQSDKIKLEWCEKHHMNLIRIKEDNINNLKIEDLIPGPSKYQVNSKFYIGQ